MPGAAQTSVAAFPPSLDQVEIEERIPETLSYLPRALGFVAILDAMAILSFPAYVPVRSSLSAIAIVVGLLLAGPLLIWWDFKRHPNPRVLVRRDDLVAIYRDRLFERTLPISGIRPYRLKRANTAVSILFAVFVGPLLLYTGFQSFQPVGPSAPPWLKLTAMMAAVALFEVVTAFMSYERLTAWTFALYYKGPDDKNFTMDTIGISRPDTDRLFPKTSR